MSQKDPKSSRGSIVSIPKMGSIIGKKEEPKEEKPEVGQMKKGDYMIHVFIEQAKQLKVLEGNTLDPLIQVTLMNEKKFTTSKDDVGSTGVVSWMEHIFFEPKGVSVEQIEQAKIQIKLLDKGFFKDSIVGMYEFDVTYVYFMKQHTMYHQWVALSNPASPNFNEVTGYLKLSISVTATGDEQIQINEDTSTQFDEESIMMPPTIKPEYFQIKFRFFKAEKLPIMDAAIFGQGGSIDAYIICKYMGQQLKTKVYTMKNDLVVWNQEFLLPCQLPIMSGRLVMKLYDQDKLSDEIVGSMIFNLKDIIGDLNGSFFWKNVYGSPLDVSGEQTNIMNANPDIASTWKGRILMQVLAEKVEKPQIKVQNLKDDITDLSFPHTISHEYEIMAEIGVGIALPAAHKYTVKIKIADFEIKTDVPQIAENTFNRWNYRSQKLVFKTSYQKVKDMGKVFIYLMDGEKPVCFAKDDIMNFTDPNAIINWIELEPDLSVGRVKEHYKAGLISFKLSIHDKTTNGPIDFSHYPSWKRPPPKRPQIKKVRAFVFQCRDLPAADSDGQSDPYVQIWDTGKSLQKTRYIEDNVNPLYYETIELMYEANSIQEMPPFVFDIFDKDFGVLEGDDFICRALIPISEAEYTTNDEVPKPKWHPCRLKKGAPECGEILVSFSIVADDFNYKTPLSYVDLMETVNFDEYVVEMNILGLRDLQSVGFLPVKKAFIQFSIKSLLPPNCAQAIDNIKTQPGPAGPNPTINTLIKFSLPLPNDRLYCPKLQCTVFDNIFKSFLQPLLGVFTIPIGDLLFQGQLQKKEELEHLDNILEELEKIIKEIGVVYYPKMQEQKIATDDLEFREYMNEQKLFLRKSISGASSSSKKSLLGNSLNKSLLDKQFKPLLGNVDDDNNSQISRSHFSSLMRSPRKTPNDLLSVSGSKKKGALRLPTVQFDKFLHTNKTQLILDRKEEEDKIKRLVESERQRELEQFKRQSKSSFKTLIMPQYYLDARLNVHREKDAPPESLYLGLGYDDKPEDNRRHYRRFYTEELEKVKEIMPRESPFDQFTIKRGQSRGVSKGWWPFSKKKEDESGSITTELIAGKFKGLISIESETEKFQHQDQKDERIHALKMKLNHISLQKLSRPADLNIDKLDSMEGRMKFMLQMEDLGLGHLDITTHLSNMQTEETLKRLLLTQTKCVVRLYVISAFNLSSRDNGSPSDPYLYLTLGNKHYNERKNYILDEPNPEFYKSYEFEATFPGCPPLNLQIYDYDELFGDDLIGETKIDLEDRFFSPEWQSCKHKPIEYRQLYHQSSAMGQGTVLCWVDIFPTSMDPQDMKPFDIQPRPPQKFEIRVVVYDTEDIKMMDVEGTSDVFFRVFFDNKEQVKETDTHYRCSDGKASFNYRLLLDVTHPRKNYNLSFQAFDRDFFKSNDIIGESLINLKLAIEDASLANRPVSINKKYYEQYLQQQGIKLDFKDEDSFWLQLNARDKKNNMEKTGKVRVRIDVYPEEHAKSNKVGEARNEPNTNPFLPPPFGRISLTFNPIKMFEQLVPPAMRRKIYVGCCLAICAILCIAMFPMIFSNIVSRALTAWI